MGNDLDVAVVHAAAADALKEAGEAAALRRQWLGYSSASRVAAFASSATMRFQ